MGRVCSWHQFVVILKFSIQGITLDWRLTGILRLGLFSTPSNIKSNSDVTKNGYKISEAGLRHFLPHVSPQLVYMSSLIATPLNFSSSSNYSGNFKFHSSYSKKLHVAVAEALDFGLKYELYFTSHLIFATIRWQLFKTFNVELMFKEIYSCWLGEKKCKVTTMLLSIGQQRDTNVWFLSNTQISSFAVSHDLVSFFKGLLRSHNYIFTTPASLMGRF